MPFALGLVLFFGLFFPKSAFATSLPVINITSSSINAVIGEPFTLDASVSGLTVGQTFNLKVLLGNSPTTMSHGQTQTTVSGTASWLSYTDSWSSFPIFTIGDQGFWSGSVVGRPNDSSFVGQNFIALRLKKTDQSSSCCDSASIAAIINAAPAENVSVETETADTIKVLPSFEINVPNVCILGEYFKVSSNLKNFNKDTEYYLKLRGGPDESHVTKIQTKNGDSYFSDNEGWENFPIIKTDSSGNWSGDIWGLLGEDKDEGIYKIKLRVRKKETDTFSESEFKDLKFSKPVVVIVPVATKSSIVATPTAQIKTKEPEVLGVATEIATPAPVKTQVIPKKDFSPLAILGGGLVFVAIIMAAFLHKDRLWDIIKRCKISWPHFS